MPFHSDLTYNAEAAQTWAKLGAAALIAVMMGYVARKPRRRPAHAVKR
jgi:hypothetical protein